MDVQIGEVEGAIVVQISGDVDGSSAPALQEQVLGAASPGCRMVMDMSNCSFMSSAGLRIMLLLHREICGASGQLVLAGLSDDLKNTMEATGFLKHFAVADSLDEGIAAVAG